jgi:lactate 2-monooxygenase
MKSSIIKAAQSSGKLTIFLDSGIRTGSDIIKALALGAQAVLRKSPPLLELSEVMPLTNTLKIQSGSAMAVRFHSCRTSRR